MEDEPYFVDFLREPPEPTGTSRYNALYNHIHTCKVDIFKILKVITCVHVHV